MNTEESVEMKLGKIKMMSEEDLDELREEDRLDALGIPLEEREKE